MKYSSLFLCLVCLPITVSVIYILRKYNIYLYKIIWIFINGQIVTEPKSMCLQRSLQICFVIRECFYTEQIYLIRYILRVIIIYI